jgi:hypothetical protein
MKGIELDSILFNPLITKEDILRFKTQEEIYSFYMGEDIKHLGVRHSPLRNDDIPSFNLYFHRHHKNTLMFKDYATGDCGDFVVLVQKLFGISYKDALFKIASDLEIISVVPKEYSKNIVFTRITRKDPVKLGIKIRPWDSNDKYYWGQFCISKATLIKYNVHPISHVFFNDNGILLKTLAYAYVEYKDNEITYKIYKPLAPKTEKWINNANSSVHQGYTQLPQTGNMLILTKSLKDVMAIHDCLNIPAVGLQSESVLIKESVLEEYLQRFQKVICLFDNDTPGKNLTAKFVEKFNLPYFFMPEVPKVTDFSDSVKFLGKEKTVEITKNIIQTL